MNRQWVMMALLAGTLAAHSALADPPSFPTSPPLYYDLAQMPPNAADANVFLQKESKTVNVPPAAAGKAARFEVRDDQARVVLKGAANKTVDLGDLGIGWYRVDFFDADDAPLGWTTAAILAAVPKHARQDSPVAVDAALSWITPDSDRDRKRVTEIAARAGVLWVRDRLRWREVETGPGEYAPQTKYDHTANLQHESGMNVLQVFHDMPEWAKPKAEAGRERAVPDLRAVHAFGKAMAKRFHGSVQAWEPWNEANCGGFGAWPIHLMCAWQKAAYLGFKEGDRRITVCWQPIAGINTASLASAILLNETWPYFDAYSIHSYDWNTSYASLWEYARLAASGKPIWVTESDRAIHAEKDAAGGEPDMRLALLKAQFIGQSYADSLAAGATRHFHFILGQYMENTVQFGLLRQDMTPRPGYVALAAVARALNGTHCVGRLSLFRSANTQVVAFHGRKKDVLVKWVENSGEWETRGGQHAPVPRYHEMLTGDYTDYLGRPIATPGELTGAPVFEELPPSGAAWWPLAPVPPSDKLEGTPSPVVLQPDLPCAELRLFKPEWTEEYNYVLPPNSETPLDLWIYNFSKKTVQGSAPRFELPGGWSCESASKTVEVAPGERARVSYALKTGSLPGDPTAEFWVWLQGRFGGAGRPSAAFRVRLLKPNGEAQ